MSGWGPPKRTAADRERDLVMFLTGARPEKIKEVTAEELAARYGVPIMTAKYRLALALGRMG